LNHIYSYASRQCSYGINVGLKRNTAFVICNEDFALGDVEYNSKKNGFEEMFDFREYFKA
jgi:hypothetical protein